MTDEQTTAADRKAGQGEKLQRKQTESLQELELRSQHRLAMRSMMIEETARMPLTLRMWMDPEMRASAMEMAIALSKAKGFVGEHLIGRPESCMAVVSMSINWNLDPFSVARHTYNPGGDHIAIDGQLTQAIIEASGKIKGEIRSEPLHGDWSKIVGHFERRQREKNGKKTSFDVATWKSEDEKGVGLRFFYTRVGDDHESHFDFYLEQAWPRNATTWPTRPEQQLHYAGVRAMAARRFPSLIMGMPTVEDFSAPPMREINPEDASPARDPLDVLAGDAQVVDGEAIEVGTRPAPAGPAGPTRSRRREPLKRTQEPAVEATSAEPVEQTKTTDPPVGHDPETGEIEEQHEHELTEWLVQVQACNSFEDLRALKESAAKRFGQGSAFDQISDKINAVLRESAEQADDDDEEPELELGG